MKLLNLFSFYLILSSFYLKFFLVFCGDGVGDNILKILKTTTPLRRPQKNGYFLNVHEEEDLNGLQNDAIEKGLETRIEQLKGELLDYYDDVQKDHQELNLEKSVRRRADLVKTAFQASLNSQ